MNIGKDNVTLLNQLSSSFMSKNIRNNDYTIAVGQFERHGNMDNNLDQLMLDASSIIQRPVTDLDGVRHLGGGSALDAISNPTGGAWYGGEINE